MVLFSIKKGIACSTTVLPYKHKSILETKQKLMPERSINRCLLISGAVIVILLSIMTFALAAATLGTLIKRFDAVENKLSSSTGLTQTSSSQSTGTTTAQPSESTSSTTVQPPQNSTLVGSIDIEEILGYLKELQNIANISNGTRAINTPGFNRTLDYIIATIKANTDFVVTQSFFPVRDFALDGDPILISSINNVTKYYTYSSNPTSADFLHVKYGTSSNISNIFQLTVIPNGGCTETDWNNASQSTVNRVALVKRGGSCAFADRAAQAAKFNVSGILFYNDGVLPDRNSPIEVSLGQDNALPALFLSFPAGQALADAVLDTSIDVTVQLGITLQDLPDFPVGNICADTPTGNATQTIVIGSHSDSVPAGPGINDNG